MTLAFMLSKVLQLLLKLRTVNRAQYDGNRGSAHAFAPEAIRPVHSRSGIRTAILPRCLRLLD